MVSVNQPRKKRRKNCKKPQNSKNKARTAFGSAVCSVNSIARRYQMLILFRDDKQMKGFETASFLVFNGQPWARIGPFFIGMITGYLLLKWKDKQIHIHWVHSLFQTVDYY